MKILKDFPFENQNLYALKTLAHTLTYLNSMLNPFLYTIMGDNFRKQAFAQKNRLKSYYTQRNKSTSLTNSNIMYCNRKSKLNSINYESQTLKSLIKDKEQPKKHFKNGTLVLKKEVDMLG